MKPLLNKMLSLGRINYAIFDQQGIIQQTSTVMGDLYSHLKQGENFWSLHPQLQPHQDEILGLNQQQGPITVEIEIKGLGLNHVWNIYPWEEEGQYIGLLEATVEETTLVKGQQVLAETISLTGNHFFKALVKGLAKKFNFPYVFLGSLTTESNQIETLAFWHQHRLMEPQTYVLDQTPCHIVHSKQSVCFYPWDLRRELNPQAKQALPSELNSYFAMPLINSHHKVLGYLCILDQQPLVGLEELYTVINLLCHRAVVEIEQQRSAQELNLIKTTLAAQVKQRTEELNRTNESLQQELHHRTLIESQLKAQYEVTSVLSQCISLEDAIPKLLTCLCQSLEWELAEWWLVDGSLLKLNQYYVHSADTELRRFSLHSLQTTFTKGVNLPGLAWQNKTLQYLDAIENREQFRRHLWLGSKTFKSALALPILASDTDQVIGVILLATRSPKSLNQDQLTTLETIGNNIQQFLTIDRVNDELKCMKEALDHSALVTIADPQGFIIYANDKFCETAGYKRHELEGQTHRLIKSDHHNPEFFTTLWETISAGQVWQGEIKNQKKNGDCYWVKSTIIPFLDSYGKPFKYLSVRFDITELVAAKEKLKQKDTFLTSILDNVPQYIFWKDTKSVFLGCNQKFAESVGLEHPKQIVGKTDYDVYPPSEPARSARYRQEDQHVLNSESPVFDILENRHEEGKDNWFTTNKLPLYNAAHDLIGILGTVENITDRIKAEAELQRFFELSLDLLCIANFDGYFVRLNPIWGQTFGLTPEEMRHRPFMEFIHPDDRAKTEVEMAKLLRGENVNNFENRYLTATGETVWLSWSAIPLMEERLIYAVAKNITDRHIYEDILEVEHRQLQKIITDAPVAIAMLDCDLKYIAHSAQWLKDFSLDSQSLIGQSHLDFFSRLAQTHQKLYQQVLQGQFLKSSEETWLLDDGQPICVRWAMQPWFTLEQKIGGIIIVVQEISELVTAREAALEVAQTKARFLANMSHEIRTPMNGVIGMTDLLIHTSLDRRQKDFVTTLKTCGKNLMLLIDDILDFSKLEAGQLNLDIKPFNIFDCLAQVKKVLDGQAYQKRIELQISIDPGTPPILKGDANRLAQILLNLVGNGIKFTEHGKVSLRVRPQEIDSSHITLYFEIIDTGIGIALQEQERLFQSFSQIDNSSTRQYGGTGLGLAISKQLVSLMAGQIGVLSQLNKGSTFWFTVNLESVDATNSPYPSPIYLNNVSNNLIPDFRTDSIQQLNVLIIDRPSSPTYFQLTQHLELWQMSWQQTTNESQSIKFLQQETFDLVLWDLDTLSAGKGRSLINHIQPIPCVLLASLSQYLEVRTLLHQGINQYLLKPINPNILVNTILLTLEGQRNNFDLDQTGSVIPEYSQDLKLLVVEDTAVNRKVVRNLLSLLNIQADFATNGAEAFSKVQQNKYNVILMDCLMPIMDGYEATRLIRSQEQSTNDHIVIIAMTANAMKGDREKCLQSGMDDYITKPLDLQKLSAVLSTWDKEKNLNNQVINFYAPKDTFDGIPTTLPVLDFDYLEQLTLGDKEFQSQLIETFLEDSEDYMREFNQALVTKNVELIKQKSHQLKGASSTIGAVKINELSKEIENLTKHEDLAPISPLVEKLPKLFNELSNILSSMDYGLSSSQPKP